MNPSITTALICLLMVTTSCTHQTYANNNSVIIDTKNVDMQQYQADLYDCEQYANQIEVAERAAKSAGTGAVIGGVLGAIVGNSSTAGRGAGVGAVTGAVKGTRSGLNEKQRVVRNCLRGRGYRVLN